MENSNDELSNKEVTANGIVTNARNGMEVPCPTCHRKGRVIRADCIGVPMSYCGPNGERFPMETCRTCSGTGWVFM